MVSGACSECLITPMTTAGARHTVGCIRLCKQARRRDNVGTIADCDPATAHTLPNASCYPAWYAAQLLPDARINAGGLSRRLFDPMPNGEAIECHSSHATFTLAPQ